MIEIQSPPTWWNALLSGSGLPPEPPFHSDDWRPDWDWFELLLGLYCAYIAYIIIDDLLWLKAKHATTP